MFQKYPENEKTISSCGPLIYHLVWANIPYLYDTLFEKQADQPVRPESSDWESAICLGDMTKKEYYHCVLEIRP